MAVITDALRAHIAAAIGAATGIPFRPATVSPVAGGCINRAVRLADAQRSFFVKINDAEAAAMFEAERAGLTELAAAGALRVPAPVASGCAGGAAFLVLEDIPMSRLDAAGWAVLGEQLAALHGQTAAGFGWHRDNTIGTTPQPNGWGRDWLSFWRDRRLGHQLDLARDNGLSRELYRRGQRLRERLDNVLAGHAPRPSLLHGDLWGGNVAADAGGGPVLFDPAVYYGDREADLAMSELFGRFDQRFYDAYQAASPLAPGYPRRRTLYNLYHILNHFNLFGGAYAPQIAAMLDELLATID